MGILGGRKEGPPLELPEWYGGKRLPEGGLGDETSYIPRDVFEVRLNVEQDNSRRNPYTDVTEIDSSQIGDFEYAEFVIPTLRRSKGR